MNPDDEAAERRLFEAWYFGLPFGAEGGTRAGLMRTAGGAYLDGPVERMWECWKASAQIERGTI